MLDKYIGIGIIVGILGASSWLYVKHEKAVSAAFEAGKASVVQEYNREYVSDLENQLLSSKGLLEKANKSLEQNEKARKADNARYERIIDGLRLRPSRSEAVESSPGDTTSTCSTTGSGLYREDGEFLAGEAAEAAEIVRERDYYYRSLKELTEELEKLNGKN